MAFAFDDAPRRAVCSTLKRLWCLLRFRAQGGELGVEFHHLAQNLVAFARVGFCLELLLQAPQAVMQGGCCVHRGFVGA